MAMTSWLARSVPRSTGADYIHAGSGWRCRFIKRQELISHLEILHTNGNHMVMMITPMVWMRGTWVRVHVGEYRRQRVRRATIGMTTTTRFILTSQFPMFVHSTLGERRTRPQTQFKCRFIRAKRNIDRRRRYLYDDVQATASRIKHSKLLKVCSTHHHPRKRGENVHPK